MRARVVVGVLVSLACLTTACSAGAGRSQGTVGATPRHGGPAVKGLPGEPTVGPDDVPEQPHVSSGLLGSGSETCEGWTLTGALFETNSAKLSLAALEDLERLARRIEGQTSPVTLVGHADERSTPFPGGNRALSLMRARAVRRALIARFELDPELLSRAIGRGATDPVVAKSTPAAYRLNRRVEIVVQCAPRGNDSLAI